MWWILGILCALFHSLSDYGYSKNGKESPTEVLAFGRVAATALVLWILVPLEGIPVFGPDLGRAYLVGIPIELFATLLYLKALKSSPLSITAPLFAISPAFLIFTEPLLLGESVSFIGALGVLLIVAGAYTLNINRVSEGFWGPIRSLTKERGALFMLGAAFLFSITANMGRLGVLNSSPLFFGASYFSLLSLALLVPVLLKRNVEKLFNISLLIPGLIAGLSVMFHMKGVALIQTGYFISVKRLSLLFSIILGVVLLKERAGKERFIAGLIMLVGVVTILLFR